MDFTQRITLDKVELFPIRAEGGVSPNMTLGTMPTRPALLIRITDSDGCYGWGEVWANFPPRTNTHKANLIEDVISPKLVGMSFIEPREIQEQLRNRLSVYFLHVGQLQVFEHILAGIDIAIWDLSLRKANTSFAQHRGLHEPKAPCYASSINTNDVERLVPQHIELGQRYFKLKVGFLSSSDRDLVKRASTLCAQGARIMVDSNQSWTLPEAKEALRSLEEFDPLFAEESLPANSPVCEWEELAKATSVALAGGENIYGVTDFIRMANAGMKVLQPDVAKWGGVTGALDLADALPADTMLWPHYMGTAVGQMAALSVTAAIGGNSICEMDVNNNALRTELCGQVMTINNGSVALVSVSGLVCEPLDEQLLAFRDQ